VLLDIDAESLKQLRQMIAGKEKDAYRVEFTALNTRSLPQNARFHAVITQYAKKVGLDVTEAKCQVKHEFGIVFPYDPELFTPPRRQGIFVEIYQAIEFQISTTEYTKAEFSKLMEGLDRLCAEAGI
jgi:hypothetical protein